MNAFCRALRWVMVVVVAFFSSAALATGAENGGPRWACWYESSNLTIRCLLSRAPETDHEIRAAEVARSIDNRLSPLVQTIWGSPETLYEDQISIPLWNVPFEMAFAMQLAESVMCGARRDCSVHFDANPDGRAPVRAAALRSGASESEVMAELATQGFVLAAVVETAGAIVEAPTTKRRRYNLF